VNREELIELIEAECFVVDDHELTEDLVIEFFDFLPIEYMFMTQKLSSRVVSEFKEDLVNMLGQYMYDNFLRIVYELKKYEIELSFYVGNVDYVENSYFSIGIAAKDFEFNIKFLKGKTPTLLASHYILRKINIILVTEFTGKGFVQAINEFLFDIVK